MPRFEHLRHKPPNPLERDRELVLVVSPLRSAVNLSRMVRLAGCSGITQIIYFGRGKVDPTIARDAIDHVEVKIRRSLVPALAKLKQDGFHMVGLEQTSNSQSLYDYSFERKTALVIGAERDGLSQECLDLLDAVIEIPVFGPPASYNVATATTMAVYEYCKQYPQG